MIKAIETVYNGYRFRSRLEARWAVFFDELSIGWEYEPQGFNLGKLGYYLPDFLLPDIRYVIEIKGIEPTLDEYRKLEAVIEPINANYGTILWGGIPLPNQINSYEIENADSIHWKYTMYHASNDNGKVVTWEDGPYIWCECDRCGKIEMHYEGRSARVSCECPHHERGGYDKEYNANSRRLLDAYAAARQARFEHGQVGAPSNW